MVHFDLKVGDSEVLKNIEEKAIVQLPKCMFYYLHDTELLCCCKGLHGCYVHLLLSIIFGPQLEMLINR